MVCGVCGTKYCTCKHKRCPDCAKAQAQNQVLMEYTGNSSQLRVNEYLFTQQRRQQYVKPEDAVKMDAIPSLRRVEKEAVV